MAPIPRCLLHFTQSCRAPRPCPAPAPPGGALASSGHGGVGCSPPVFVSSPPHTAIQATRSGSPPSSDLCGYPADALTCVITNCFSLGGPTKGQVGRTRFTQRHPPVPGEEAEAQRAVLATLRLSPFPGYFPVPLPPPPSVSLTTEVKMAQAQASPLLSTRPLCDGA